MLTSLWGWKSTAIVEPEIRVNFQQSEPTNLSPRPSFSPEAEKKSVPNAIVISSEILNAKKIINDLKEKWKEFKAIQDPESFNNFAMNCYFPELQGFQSEAIKFVHNKRVFLINQEIPQLSAEVEEMKKLNIFAIENAIARNNEKIEDLEVEKTKCFNKLSESKNNQNGEYFSDMLKLDTLEKNIKDLTAVNLDLAAKSDILFEKGKEGAVAFKERVLNQKISETKHEIEELNAKYEKNQKSFAGIACFLMASVDSINKIQGSSIDFVKELLPELHDLYHHILNFKKLQNFLPPECHRELDGTFDKLVAIFPEAAKKDSLVGENNQGWLNWSLDGIKTVGTKVINSGITSIGPRFDINSVGLRLGINSLGANLPKDAGIESAVNDDKQV